MLQNKIDKASAKMRSARSGKKEAGSSFFRQDAGSFFNKQQSKRSSKDMSRSKASNMVVPSSNVPRPPVGTVNLQASAKFETRDRLVTSVQSYMALFTSLGDAGMSLSTSVHSVLSEIGFTEIAGQLSKGFNDINDISQATFDEMKDFVEKVVDAWETSADGKSLTTQSVLQVLAYLLKTQLNFLQTASEHISEVLHTQYSGKTMLELLGGEAFFLTPPSTPTKTSPSKSSTPAVVPNNTIAAAVSSKHPGAVAKGAAAAGERAGHSDTNIEKAEVKPDNKAATPSVTQSPGHVTNHTQATSHTTNKTPSQARGKLSTDSSLTTSASSSKTTSDESLFNPPPSDTELFSVIDMLSGAHLANQQSASTRPRPPGLATANQSAPGHASQYAPFLYTNPTNSHQGTAVGGASSHLTAPPVTATPPGGNPGIPPGAPHHAFMQGLGRTGGVNHHNNECASAVPYEFASNLLFQNMDPNRWNAGLHPQQLLAAALAGNADFLPTNYGLANVNNTQSALIEAMAVAQQNSANDPTVSGLSDKMSLTAKTHTWPMRPGGRDGMESALPPNHPLQHPSPTAQIPCAADLEFSQYVNAVQRRNMAATGSAASRVAAMATSVGGGGSMGSSRGSIDNPWSAGDSAMAWPPYVGYQDNERKQWLEDSSNCSDESSSNNGADWLNTSEHLSRDLAAKHAFNNAALNEARTTKTWPLKQQQWPPSRSANQNTEPDPRAMMDSSGPAPMLYAPPTFMEGGGAMGGAMGPMPHSASMGEGLAKNW